MSPYAFGEERGNLTHFKIFKIRDKHTVSVTYLSTANTNQVHGRILCLQVARKGRICFHPL